METFSRPPPKGTSDCADPEASWGHRKNNLLRCEDELFFGYYFSAGIMTPDSTPAGPGVRARITLSSCRRPCPRARPRPDRAARRRDRARRHPRRLRLRPPHPRELGSPAARSRAQLIQTSTPTTAAARHPPRAIISNGNLYCPATPRALLELRPLARDATREQAASHDTRTTELARYKLSRITSDDPDGYHRVTCPAAMGKTRCPLRPASMTLYRDRPEILTPPEHPPTCCTQQTLTVPPDTLAKTAQKHDYPSAAHRRSYSRRTGANAASPPSRTPPATTSPAAGAASWPGPPLLFTTCLTVTRNLRITTAWDRRQEDNARPPPPPAAQNPPPAPQAPGQPRRSTAITRTRHPLPPRARPASSVSMPGTGTRDTKHQPGTQRTDSERRKHAKCQIQMQRSPKAQT